MLFGLYVWYAPLPLYPVQKVTRSITFTATDIQEGKRIAQTICIRCHYNYETGTLAGRQHGNPKRLGSFYSGNITNDSVTGIGKWTTDELYFFLKTGIKPNGKFVFDMPKYPNLSENDINGIIGYLKSNDTLVKATRFLNPPPKYSLVTKLLLHTVIIPPVYRSAPVLPPDSTNLIVYGRYLATAKFSCYECHSLNTVTNNYNNPEKSWGYFKGGNPHANEDFEKIYTPDITGNQTGIGTWTEQQFIRTLKNGIKPNGTSVKDPMFPFHLLTDREATAIYQYLKTVK